MTELWLTILGMGLVTFAVRLSLIVAHGRLELPTLARRALRFVPPAVLAAIIAPAVLLPQGRLDLSLANTRLLAGVVAAVVAWRTRSVVLTIAAGMAALWILSAVL